ARASSRPPSLDRPPSGHRHGSQLVLRRGRGADPARPDASAGWRRGDRSDRTARGHRPHHPASPACRRATRRGLRLSDPLPRGRPARVRRRRPGRRGLPLRRRASTRTPDARDGRDLARRHRPAHCGRRRSARLRRRDHPLRRRDRLRARPSDRRRSRGGQAPGARGARADARTRLRHAAVRSRRPAGGRGPPGARALRRRL
ncbi:MAG: hypothetical protein AVDCRST_MAG17-2296, partial [uncultured Solirubrobacterales bacterium]